MSLVLGRRAIWYPAARKLSQRDGGTWFGVKRSVKRRSTIGTSPRMRRKLPAKRNCNSVSSAAVHARVIKRERSRSISPPQVNGTGQVQSACTTHACKVAVTFGDRSTDGPTGTLNYDMAIWDTRAYVVTGIRDTAHARR